MASRVLNVQDVFSTGTSVKAIKQANWSTGQLPPSADVGSADDTKTVAADGTLTFTALADGTAYFATATVSGTYRAVGFNTPPAIATQTYVGTQDFSGSSLVLPGSMKTTTAAVLQADVGPISSQTTLQNITGLGLPIGTSATEMWRFSSLLLVNAANITMDVKLGVSLPAGASGYWGSAYANSSVGGIGGTSATGTTPTASVPLSSTLGFATLAGTCTIYVVGVLLGGGTAGTAQIQYAQTTSDPGNLSILRGSLMEAVKVAS